ncbi:hypothetical protein FP2506_13029 [Fulvimarina pelagi HTCC2506]|uniref:Alginate lyase domain-containing protein n=2 Tax=Fulvimarina pelagi TaxID=217511 RepID=Q0G190_9HYPH|nr:alginate lyase family protein [Fulvimarina pelagi]EAU41191.1 hypothetical protein FP2506_13029 [Fulvimarina pelagi HTCC2506]BAT30798.1 hypothetical protein [Fulvimarina pelagi]
MNGKLKKAIALIPGARTTKQFLESRGLNLGSSAVSELPIKRPSERGVPPALDEDALRAAYAASPLSSEPDTFVLYRIIGNDLVPRHAKGQSRANLRFILENEPALEACEKRFVVNKIVDTEEEAFIIELLEVHGYPYLHLPFDHEAYRAVEWDIEGVPPQFAPFSKSYGMLRQVEQDRVVTRLYRDKNNAVMHNNGARNAAFEDGRARAKWVLPFDGNCFLTEKAWTAIREGVRAAPHVPYHIVPMARILDNAELLDPASEPPAEEEPQILFRRDATERFDEVHPYGRRPKVELLWRLGVPGNWDRWPIEPWDSPYPGYAADAGQFRTTGWVARLFSGQGHLEDKTASNTLVTRGEARSEAIVTLIDALDMRFRPSCRRMLVLEDRETSGAIGSEAVEAPLQEALRTAADAALGRGPFSVTDKTSMPPSGILHDYWHPAPYYWPHPLKLPGLAYVRKDGVRVPGTRLYEPLSDKFDRTRLQRLFDDTFVLALAHREFQDTRYAEHAARHVRTWFVDETTRMNPSLNYAQVRRGHDGNRGSSSGIIEMKDLYFFLDAVKLLRHAGAFDEKDNEAFETWLGTYLAWLQTSRQGVGERASRNNHGTYFDLQVGAIALYLRNDRLVRHTLRDSRSRILAQFAGDGRQPEEMTRTTTAHYCAFNLQGWLNLASLADAAGEDLWAFEGSEGQSIGRACEWLLAHIGKEWPYQQIDAFDTDRLYPIYHAYAERFSAADIEAPLPDATAIKPIFDPHDGIRPFWQIR